MSQVIDDRHEDWFRHVMKAIEKASGDRKKVSELISGKVHEEPADAPPPKDKAA